jgi:hypothetical protein
VKNEWVNGLKGARKNLWNIFHATWIRICDVAKYSMMKLEIFYHIDKGST